jgi:N utilization substance protein B
MEWPVTGPRRQAREAALRILYLWEMGRVAPATAIETYFATHDPDASRGVVEFASVLVAGTVAEVPALDAAIQEHSEHWRLERLPVVDRLILRMAIWELRHDPDTPSAVVLNEALELARAFSTDEAVRFVNGVLDAVRKAMNR